MVSYYKLLLSIFFFVLINTLISFAEPLLNVEQVIEEKSVLTGKEIKGKLVLKNKGDELLIIIYCNHYKFNIDSTIVNLLT